MKQLAPSKPPAGARLATLGRLALASAVALAWTGCARCSGDEPARERAAGPTADATGPGAPDVGPLARSLAESLETAAAERLGDPCERAYAIMLSLARASKRPAPRPVEFLEICRELPEEMQLCLSPAHQLDNFESCVATREALDPELLRRLQEVVAGP